MRNRRTPSSSWPRCWTRRDNAVAKIYYRKIKNGDMSIDQVPDRWKGEVLALLTADQIQE